MIATGSWRKLSLPTLALMATKQTSVGPTVGDVLGITEGVEDGTVVTNVLGTTASVGLSLGIEVVTAAVGEFDSLAVVDVKVKALVGTVDETVEGCIVVVVLVGPALGS